MPPPSLLFTDASRTGWGAHLDDLTLAGGMDRGRTQSPKHFGGEGSSVSFCCLKRSDRERIRGLDKQQCHSGSVLFPE